MAIPISRAALITPRHVVTSAWLEHAPFASWLVDRIRPTRFVELGTHFGFSYFSVCETVKLLQLGTECHAIDTFEGDEHAGFYDDSVYDGVIGRNSDYSAFSSIHRMTFAKARDTFEDHSVDLLHIDGRHFYDDVLEDYQSWYNKLTPSAVVLFHDTNVKDRGFGVWKLFAELKENHPTFEFLHGHGLGVLAPRDIPPQLADLFELGENDVEDFRKSMKILGHRLSLQHALNENVKELSKSVEGHNESVEELARSRSRIQELESEILDHFAAKEREISQIHAAYRRSTSWRITAPLRKLKTWAIPKKVPTG